MKPIYIILMLLGTLSCKTKVTKYNSDLNSKETNSSSSNNSIDLVKSPCEETAETSKVDFLSRSHTGITWNDEHKILPCWLSEIEQGNSMLESILYSRMEDRIKAIRSGQFSLISIDRINDTIFSRIPTVHMLKIAMDYASIDTCVSYSGEDPTHFGFLGINNLKGMFSPKYLQIYNNYYFEIITDNKVLKRYREDSCEYISYLYHELYRMVYQDYQNDKIQLKESRLIKN